MSTPLAFIRKTVLAATLAWWTPPSAQALEFSVTDLGVLNGCMSHAFGLNRFAAVVGQIDFCHEEHTTHAFLWTAASGMQDLGVLPGGYSSWANDINNRQQVVGGSFMTPGYFTRRAFIWEAGVMTDLGTLGGTTSDARAINNAGRVVGFAAISDEHAHAVYWENDVITDLGTLGGRNSYAEDVNEQGHVAGWSEMPWWVDNHAVIWVGGTAQDLGTLGGAWSKAYAINDAGQVIGLSQTADLSVNVFMWSNGAMTDLGLLGASPTPSLKDLHDRGIIVGQAYPPGPYDPEGFIWKDGRLAFLNDLIPGFPGYDIISADAINRRGQLATTSLVPGGGNYSHALLLTPLR